MLRHLVSPVFPFGSPTLATASPTWGATPSPTWRASRTPAVDTRAVASPRAMTPAVWLTNPAMISAAARPLPQGTSYSEVSFDVDFNNSNVWWFEPCSYAALVGGEWFEFSASCVTSSDLIRTPGMRAQLMLGWSIGGEACEVARKNRTAYACVSEHRESVNSISGPGCLCDCSTDCQGSSYLSDDAKTLMTAKTERIIHALEYVQTNQGDTAVFAHQGSRAILSLMGLAIVRTSPWQ